MGKRIILSCDGTWCTPWQSSPTNVYRFHTAIADVGADGVRQVALYHAGVGTGPLQRITGGAFGVGLSKIVQNVYRFVVENYERGDELYLLGFSRGAFTARSTAGFIANAGILRRDEVSRVGEAYALYRNAEPVDAPSAIAFRRAYSVSETTPIRFIGVWDTVGALGVPSIGIPGVDWLNRRVAFHNVTLGRSVQSAYHAIAIDEHRGPFVPTLWNTLPPIEGQQDQGQQLEQQWFAGCHSNVGGGLDDHGLSDVTLAWMTAKAAECGVTFKQSALVGDPLAAARESRVGIYRLAGKPIVRHIGTTDPASEESSSAAIERVRKLPYRPANLMAYLGLRSAELSQPRP